MKRSLEDVFEINGQKKRKRFELPNKGQKLNRDDDGGGNNVNDDDGGGGGGGENDDNVDVNDDNIINMKNEMMDDNVMNQTTKSDHDETNVNYELEKRRKDFLSVLKQEKDLKKKDVLIGQWMIGREQLIHVKSPKGKLIESMGIPQKDNSKLLHAEEALFLIDRGLLRFKYDENFWIESIENAFEFFFRHTSLTISHYVVYCTLKRHGLAVKRHNHSMWNIWNKNSSVMIKHVSHQNRKKVANRSKHTNVSSRCNEKSRTHPCRGWWDACNVPSHKSNHSEVQKISTNTDMNLPVQSLVSKLNLKDGDYISVQKLFETVGNWNIKDIKEEKLNILSPPTSISSVPLPISLSSSTSASTSASSSVSSSSRSGKWSQVNFIEIFDVWIRVKEVSKTRPSMVVVVFSEEQSVPEPDQIMQFYERFRPVIPIFAVVHHAEATFLQLDPTFDPLVKMKQ